MDAQQAHRGRSLRPVATINHRAGSELRCQYLFDIVGRRNRSLGFRRNEFHGIRQRELLQPGSTLSNLMPVTR
jgi:hypothetical protein